MDFINEFFRNLDVPFLTALVAGTMAIIFNKVPKAKLWFDKKSPDEKRNWMVGFVVFTAVALFSLDCASLLDTNLVCEPRDIVNLLYAIMFGGAVNQTAHNLSNTRTIEG